MWHSLSKKTVSSPSTNLYMDGVKLFLGLLCGLAELSIWTLFEVLLWFFGFFVRSVERAEWKLTRFMLDSTWLFKFIGTWICTGSDMFDTWFSTFWFMEMIWVWGNIKFRSVEIQIKQLTLTKDLGSIDALLMLLVSSRANVSSIWTTVSCSITTIWVVCLCFF